MIYRVKLRRESEQEVEFDDADLSADEREVGPIEAAVELADPSDWFTDGVDADAVSVSDDGGTTWRALRMTEVLALERLGQWL